jgi:pyruvate dehydrogenase complex dehydrogenase (E1) component
MKKTVVVYTERTQSVLDAIRKVIRYASEEERAEVLQDLKKLVESHPVEVPRGRPATWKLP